MIPLQFSPNFHDWNGCLRRGGGAVRVVSSSYWRWHAVWRDKPRLMLLDEPTEGIQPSIIEEIIATLLRLKQSHQLTGAGGTKSGIPDGAGRSHLLLQKGEISGEGDVMKKPPGKTCCANMPGFTNTMDAPRPTGLTTWGHHRGHRGNHRGHHRVIIGPLNTIGSSSGPQSISPSTSGHHPSHHPSHNHPGRQHTIHSPKLPRYRSITQLTVATASRPVFTVRQ